MSGTKLLFDSNIIIYLSKKLLDARAFTKIEDVPCISVITYMEVMGYRFKYKSEKEFIENFCTIAHLIELDKSIVTRVVKLRSENNIKLPDAIIAATALEANMTLITHNASDFKGISGLNLLDPLKK
ncbi:MAG: type II toxin-antitoxin system VapC family toxin [Chitinophagaceae bacterium]|nr:MAG: type II toxin-antitoxin system VapC family toxin [Chitinophagaceae bacterium]